MGRNRGAEFEAPSEIRAKEMMHLRRFFVGAGEFHNRKITTIIAKDPISDQWEQTRRTVSMEAYIGIPRTVQTHAQLGARLTRHSDRHVHRVGILRFPNAMYRPYLSPHAA